MPETAPSSAQVLTQLQRILGSDVFGATERRSRFLRYAVEKTLEGHARDIKEYTVALEVFDRRDFDSEQDSIVRVEARKLRASLDKYYATSGVTDGILIGVPKGSYAASFAFRDVPPQPILRMPASTRRDDLVPQGRWATLAALLLLVFTAGVATSSRWNHSDETLSAGVLPNSLAVLPFRSLSGEKSDQYFADGMTEQLIHTLGGLKGKRIVAPGSLKQFKNEAPDVRQAGKALRASFVLEGSVRRVDQLVRITVRGSDTLTGQQLWSHTYDRTPGDLAAVQDEIARDVASSFLSRGVGLDEAILARRKSANPDAYQYYLRGLSGYNRATREGLERSIEDLRLAVASDPQYAPAYSALADCYVALSIYSFWPPRQAAEQARSNAERALTLDSSLADAEADLGFVAAAYDWNPEEAERHFRKSIDMNASCAHCRAWYALYTLAPWGRYEEARQQVIQAEAVDPMEGAWPSFRIAVAVYSGRFEEGLEEGRRIATPENRDFRAHAAYAVALRRAGRMEESLLEARRAAELSGNHPLVLRVLGAVLASAGQRQEALSVREQLERQSPHSYVSPAAIAVINHSLGDREAFLRSLTHAVETRDPTLVFLRAWVDVNGDSDPRLESLLAKIRIFR